MTCPSLSLAPCSIWPAQWGSSWPPNTFGIPQLSCCSLLCFIPLCSTYNDLTCHTFNSLFLSATRMWAPWGQGLDPWCLDLAHGRCSVNICWVDAWINSLHRQTRRAYLTCFSECRVENIRGRDLYWSLVESISVSSVNWALKGSNWKGFYQLKVCFVVSATAILGNCLKIEARDCPSGLVVKNLPCSAGDSGWSLVWELRSQVSWGS